MTRRELLAWLDTRRPAPPAALRAHLEAQLSDSEERLPDHLAELGRAMLARVTGRPSRREVRRPLPLPAGPGL